MGLVVVPGVVNAQYTNNNSGLAASSFQLPPLPNSRHPVNLTAYAQQGQGAIGSGVPQSLPPQGYAQPAQHQDPYSLGQPQAYEAVPSSPPIYSQPAPQAVPHAHQSQPMSQPMAQPMAQPMIVQPTIQHAAPAASCPACASGTCATHGTGVQAYSAAPVYAPGPVYGAGSCGVEQSCGATTVGLSPAVVSPSPWIFGAGGLLFNRVDDYNRKLASSGTTQWLGTGDSAMRASAGFQGSIGRYFGCGRYAVVATYWGIFSDAQTTGITPGVGNPIRTDLPFTPIAPGVAPVPPWYGAYMPGPRTLYDWYDSGSTAVTNNPATHSQRVVRDNDFQNVEVNFFSFALGGGARQGYSTCGTGGCGGGYRHGGGCGTANCDPCGASYGDCGSSCDPCGSSCRVTGPTGPCAPWYGAQCSKLRLNTYGGIRWFRFGDNLEYAASQTDNIYGTTADDIYYISNVTNDLVGFQLGGLGTWCTGTRVNFFGGTSFGVYNNHVQTFTRAGTATTDAMIRPLGSPAAVDMPFNFSNSLNDVAFIGEGTLGTGICIKPGWTLNLGYRVLGVAGVATAVGQIPTEFTHASSISGIRNDRSLILHGAVFGMNYNF
jgi:hypothetical protein